MTRRASFTQADVKRAVAALKAVGECIAGVEYLPGGGFKVLTGAPKPPEPASELERWRAAKRGERAA